MDKTTFGDPVGIGRDYACYAPDPTDCPWVSEDVNKHIFYETYDSSYYIQNVWVNEMFFKKVNQLQLEMLIRVTYLLLSNVFIRLPALLASHTDVLGGSSRVTNP